MPGGRGDQLGGDVVGEVVGEVHLGNHGVSDGDLAAQLVVVTAFLRHHRQESAAHQEVARAQAVFRMGRADGAEGAQGDRRGTPRFR